MGCVTFQHVSGAEAFKSFSDFSFAIRRNKFLNAEKKVVEQDVTNILIEMDEQIKKISITIPVLKKLHWFEEISDEELKEINNIIVSGKDVVQGFRKGYSKLKTLSGKEVDSVLEKLQDIADDLEEAIIDIEVMFFHLPEDKEFIESTKKLAILE